MRALVTIVLRSLDHLISVFGFDSNPWFLCSCLTSRKMKIKTWPAYNAKLGFLAFIRKMATKNPSIIIDDNFRRFKAEREKGDSDIQKCENQKRLIREEQKQPSSGVL